MAYVDIAVARRQLSHAGLLAGAVLSDPNDADPRLISLARAVDTLCQIIEPMLRAQPDSLRRRRRDD
jgi:hypothetical protein